MPAQFGRQRCQAFSQLRNPLVQHMAQVVGGGDQFEAFAQCARQHGRRCGGKEVGARFLQQPFNQRSISGDKGTRYASRLAQRGHVQHAA
ncbi:hypothetical protein D3C72_1977910 [compost metagenome]